MARTLLSFLGRVKGGPARGGVGRELRFYTDDTLTVAKTVYQRSSGVGTQPVPIVPNAGVPRALAADRAAGDTFVTVAVGQTSTFNVGDLLPIWNPTQGTVYRVVTVITPATGRLDLDSALGVAFTVANGTMVNATDMEGHVWGWVDDATATYMKVTELGSGRDLAPVQVASAAPASTIAVQEEGAAVNSRGTLNFIGAGVTAADDAPNNRVNVTVDAAPTAAGYVVSAADGRLSAELVLGTAVIMRGTIGTRPAAGTAGRLYISSDETPMMVYRDNGASWDAVAFDDPSTTRGDLLVRKSAGVGVDRLALGAALAVLSSDGTDALWRYPLLSTAETALGADVTTSTAATWTDLGLSLSLAAGTWLVLVALTVNMGGQRQMAFRLTDGTTHESVMGLTKPTPGSAADEFPMPMIGLVAPTGTTTWKLQYYDQIGSSATVKAASAQGASGNIASRMVAVRVG